MVLDATRKPFISGNWKLNPQSKDEATTLAKDIAASVTDSTPESDICLFVPYPFIDAAMSSVDGKITIGAEVS
jgi:triosephosphate isomerase